MNEHLPVLRRVGWVLIVIGLLDIGLMSYCILTQRSYSSSFNVFAVVAGVLLLRGHLGTTQIVTWVSAFLFAALAVCMIAVFPWLWPLDYWIWALRENWIPAAAGLALSFLLLGLLLWIYRELRSPAVLAARAATGRKTDPPKSAFFGAAAFSLLMAILMQLTMNGDTAQEAKRRAAQQHGNQYSYAVSRINWSGKRVSAQLTAYRDGESKEVEVEWER